MQIEIAETSVIVISDDAGARAYDSGRIKFKSFRKGKLTDEYGIKWVPGPDALTNEKGEQLSRLPGHNIFWFAWVNSYPDTRLIK